MRFLLAAFVSIAFLSCAPVQETRPARAVKAEEIQPSVAAVVAPPQISAPTVPHEAPVFRRVEISGITFEGVAFDSRSHRLVVADQPNGPDSLFEDATAAARSRNGLAAVNAGFFTPEGAPLGLVVSAGKTSGSWNSASSLGSGVWFEETSGKSAIARREKLGRAAAASSRELIQAGPLLVENGSPVSGLEATKSSARIAILWDGGTRWWIGHASSCTLADFSRALSSSSPAGWKIQQALNLDGGRSAELFVSDSVSGGPLVVRPPWNRPVRNFLILVRR